MVIFSCASIGHRKNMHADAGLSCKAVLITDAQALYRFLMLRDRSLVKKIAVLAFHMTT